MSMSKDDFAMIDLFGDIGSGEIMPVLPNDTFRTEKLGW